MAKKLTYENIKNFICNEETGNGCKLITTEDEFKQEKISQNKNNSHVILKMECNCGNNIEKSYDNFKHSKKQCNECSGLKRSTIKEIQHFIEVESHSNCKLLTTEYINALQLLDLECSCGKPFNKSWNKFYSANQRTCNECSNMLSGEKSKRPYEDIKYFIEIESKSGCKLSTTKDDYVNTNSDINIKCICGNSFTTTFHQFQGEQSKKQHCDECGEKLRRNNLSKSFKKGNIKRIQTLYQNNNAPCSNQQKYVYNILGGYLNYPVKAFSVDIAFPDEKIYIECDFSGHWLSVAFGRLTQKEFNRKEMKRCYVLYRSGWKEIRIISRQDNIPSDSKLLEMLAYAKHYLNQNHHYIKFDIDNSKIINSQGEFTYDYGELRKIKSKDLEEAI